MMGSDVPERATEEPPRACCDGVMSNVDGPPADGSTWAQPDSKLLNWRGDSYSSEAWPARAAGRIRQTAGYRNPDFSLRVERDLN